MAIDKWRYDAFQRWFNPTPTTKERSPMTYLLEVNDWDLDESSLRPETRILRRMLREHPNAQNVHVERVHRNHFAVTIS